MRDTFSMAQALLARVMPRDRAESIAGDLIEERAAHGPVWFWFHVVRITLGMSARNLFTAPLTARELLAWSSVLFFVFVIGAVVVPYLFPMVVLHPVSAHQWVEWKDPSTHTVKLVTVEPGVQIEVLDWGGNGRPVVLLAGLGDTAHAFDDFAPILAKQYRVYGITRRGVGASSAPASGYEIPNLAKDIVQVIDQLALNRPVLIGHSFAGEELHIVGARYSSRTAGLIYIDAAFNRGDDSDNAGYDAVARKLPPGPRLQPSDRASLDTFRAFLLKTAGMVWPESELRLKYTVNADGTIGGPMLPPVPVRQAFTAVMKESYAAYHPAPIQSPALALYAVPRSATDMMRPWYDANDAVVRENVEKLFALTRERFQGHAKWFNAFAPNGRIVEIAGAHHLFLSNSADVLREIHNFIASLP